MTKKEMRKMAKDKLLAIELTMHDNKYSSDSRYITATVFVASGIFVFLSIGKMLEFLKLV